MKLDVSNLDDRRLVAGVDMLRRTGAADMQIRVDEEQEPPVWIAVARYRVGPEGRPRATGEVNGTEVAAGMDPVEAVMRLCERMIDGSVCGHCGKPTVFHAEIADEAAARSGPAGPALALFCAYTWDPELAVIRRGCEGE